MDPNWIILGALVLCYAVYIFGEWRGNKKLHKQNIDEDEYQTWLTKHALGSAPCRGLNSNVCVGEGCYGYSCLKVKKE